MMFIGTPSETKIPLRISICPSDYLVRQAGRNPASDQLDMSISHRRSRRIKDVTCKIVRHQRLRHFHAGIALSLKSNHR